MSSGRNRIEKARLSLLAAGLSSDMADRAAQMGLTLSKLRRSSVADLSAVFSQDEVCFVRERLQRRRISVDIVFRLIDESHGKCCICGDYLSDDPIIFHHISEHSKSGDDTYENLAVLCLKHHDEAHRRSGLSRLTLIPEYIRARKQAWIEDVAAHRRGERPPPGHEPRIADQPKPRPPAIWTPVLGRQGVLTNIHELLSGGSVRIAVVGMGGVGKTLLAAKLANDLVTDFSGGVFWTSLGDYAGDAKAVMRQWGRVCGAQLPVGMTTAEIADVLRNWLTTHTAKHGQTLFVVDDARIAWIEDVRLLVRSIPSESVLFLTTREQAVATATSCRTAEIDVLDVPDAVQMLSLHAGIDVRETSEHRMHDLVALLGCLPLAIELLGKLIAALHRKPGFTLDTLVEELRKERLNRLNLPGHPALVAVFAYSYRALSDSEKRTFRYLGVFSSTLISAQDLTKIVGSTVAIEPTLDSLVGVSLLSWGERPQYYRIHPLLRDYANTLLNRKKAEAQRARSAHLTHFATIALNSTNFENDKILEMALPDVIHGVTAAGLQVPELVLELVDRLWTDGSLLSIRGYYRESAVLLESAVTAAKKLGRREVAAANLGNLGVAYSVLGKPEQAKQSYQRALALVDTLEDQYDKPAFLGNLGLLFLEQGEPGEAHSYMKAALELSLSVENYDVALSQLIHLGSFFRHRNPEKSLQHYHLAQQLAGRIGDRRAFAAATSNVGLIYFDQGRLTQAEQCIQQALSIARKLGDRQSEANRLGHLGNIAAARGESAEAIRLFETAVAINRAIGYKAREADWVSNLGMARWRTGERLEGVSAVREALQLSIESGHAQAQGVNHLRLAGMYSEMGDTLAAEYHRAEASKILGSLGAPIAFTYFEPGKGESPAGNNA